MGDGGIQTPIFYGKKPFRYLIFQNNLKKTKINLGKIIFYECYFG